MTVIICSLFLLGLLLASVLSKKPTQQAKWRKDLTCLPKIHSQEFPRNEKNIEAKTVKLENLRDFRYNPLSTTNTEDFVTMMPKWTEQTINIDKAYRVWFIEEVFGAIGAVAHTFISIEFTDGSYLALSIEARTEEGEAYSLFSGLLNNFELMVVMATEQDVLSRRAIVQEHKVYMYPLSVSPEFSQNLLRAYLQKAQKLEHNPSFYNTISKSCTSDFFNIFNKTAKQTANTPLLPWRAGRIIPGYRPEYLLKQGYLTAPTDFEIDKLRKICFISKKVKAKIYQPNFSYAIRKSIAERFALTLSKA